MADEPITTTAPAPEAPTVQPTPAVPAAPAAAAPTELTLDEAAARISALFAQPDGDAGQARDSFGRFAAPMDPAGQPPPAEPEPAPALDATATPDPAAADQAAIAALPAHLRSALERGLAAPVAAPVAPAPVVPVPAPQPGGDPIAQAMDSFRSLDAQIRTSFADLLPQPGENPITVQQRHIKAARTDPARWTEFRAMTDAASQTMGLIQQVQNAQHMQARQASITALKTMYPEWADDAKMARDVTDVRNWLKSTGVPADRADAIIDPYEISIARDAMLYRQQQASQAQARTLAQARVATLPPVQRPGARAERDTGEQAAALRQKAAATGRLDDVAALIRAQLGR